MTAPASSVWSETDLFITDTKPPEKAVLGTWLVAISVLLSERPVVYDIEEDKQRAFLGQHTNYKARVMYNQSAQDASSQCVPSPVGVIVTNLPRRRLGKFKEKHWGKCLYSVQDQECEDFVSMSALAGVTELSAAVVCGGQEFLFFFIFCPVLFFVSDFLLWNLFVSFNFLRFFFFR